MQWQSPATNNTAKSWTGIGRGSDLLVTLVSRRKAKVAACVRNDRLCPLDCPLCEIAAIFDRESFHCGDLVYSFLDACGRFCRAH